MNKTKPSVITFLYAEHLKFRRTFVKFLPAAAPVLTLLFALILTGGIENAVPSGAWNWWYTAMLPGMLSLICCLQIKKDKKIKYFHLFSLSAPATKVFCGKLLYCICCLLFSNLLMFFGTWLLGSLSGTTISPVNGFLGALLLTVSFAWEIPLLFLLSDRFGMFFCVFFGIFLSGLGIVFFAPSRFWWLFPAAFPGRLMCPLLHIQPNGLPVPEGSLLSDPSVCLWGILLSFVWFVFTALTAGIYLKRKEPS